MRAIYLDTSSMHRVLFDSSGLRAPLSTADVVVSSELLGIELARMIDQARLHRSLTVEEIARAARELMMLLKRVHLFPLAPAMVELARATFPVTCRAVDAIHVATAQIVAEET